MFARPLRSSSPDLYFGKYVAGLFANNEQGVWYDPSDLSTMFQDARGINPVTAPNQPVGLILDKSRGARLGPNLSSNPSYETGLGQTSSGNPGLVYWDQANKRAILQRQTGDYTQILIRNLVSELQIGHYYQISIDITNVSCTQGLLVICSDLTSQGFFEFHGLSSSWVGQTRTYKYILPVEKWYGNYWLFPQLNGVNIGGEIAVDNISCREISGIHARQTSTTSRPVLQRDSAGKYYLQFDGVDDWLVTPSINFTSTDKMTVFAGVTKFNNIGEFSHLVGLGLGSQQTNGFYIAAPSSAGQYTFMSAGSLQDFAFSQNPQYNAPNTSILTAISNIDDNSMLLRINGDGEVLSSSGSQGVGNYSNNPIYIGRAGSDPFDGRLYGLIVRGTQTDNLHFTGVEQYLAYKTGISI